MPALQISEEEIQRAYETQFGPQVQIRLIVHSSLEQARKIHDHGREEPRAISATWPRSIRKT